MEKVRRVDEESDWRSQTISYFYGSIMMETAKYGVTFDRL